MFLQVALQHNSANAILNSRARTPLTARRHELSRSCGLQTRAIPCSHRTQLWPLPEMETLWRDTDVFSAGGRNALTSVHGWQLLFSHSTDDEVLQSVSGSKRGCMSAHGHLSCAWSPRCSLPFCKGTREKTLWGSRFPSAHTDFSEHWIVTKVFKTSAI